MEGRKAIGFMLREIHNRIREVIRKSSPESGMEPRCAPPTQLQAGILGYLYRNRERSLYQKDIEEVFKISKATATNTLKVMEKNNMIIRRAEERDQRLKRIYLTECAIEDHKRVWNHMQYMDRRMLQNFTEEEQDTLFRLLDKLNDNIQTMLDESNQEESNKEERKEQITC